MAQAGSKQGWLQVGSARTALIDVAGGFYRLRREIEALAGIDVAERSFYAAGRDATVSVIGSLVDDGQISKDAAGFHKAVTAYADAGFGRFQVSSLDLSAGRAAVT